MFLVYGIPKVRLYIPYAVVKILDDEKPATKNRVVSHKRKLSAVFFFFATSSGILTATTYEILTAASGILTFGIPYTDSRVDDIPYT